PWGSDAGVDQGTKKTRCGEGDSRRAPGARDRLGPRGSPLRRENARSAGIIPLLGHGPGGARSRRPRGERTMRARWIALGIAAVVLSPRTAWSYTDEMLGYSISVPGGSRQTPIAPAEQRIAARWQRARRDFDEQ